MDGLWLTLIKEAAPSKLASYFSKSQKTLNKVVPKIVKENVAKFESSFENKQRSVRVLYSNGLLSKEKYKSVRLNMSTCFNSTSNKRSSLKFMHDVTVPKLLSYPKLMKFIYSINTGNVKDFSDFCNDLDDDNQVSGSYRDLEEMLLDKCILRVQGINSYMIAPRLKKFSASRITTFLKNTYGERFQPLYLTTLRMSVYTGYSLVLNFV